MSVRTILQRAGRAGAWILVGLQPGLHIRRRSWSRHKADAHTNHHARREPLRFSLQATERLIVALGSELDVPLCPHDIRFTLESRHSRCKKKCPLCAKSGHPSGKWHKRTAAALCQLATTIVIRSVRRRKIAIRREAKLSRRKIRSQLNSPASISL